MAAITLVSDDKIMSISWNELKNSTTGMTWENVEKATVLYKDEEGALIRFKDEYEEIYITYFHFI